MPKKNNNIFVAGFTLIEALIVIAIIGIMSVFYVINLRPNTAELLKMDTTRLAADIRYVRSMASSRVAYNGVFPINGYGIRFTNGSSTLNINSYYELYACTGPYSSDISVLKTVTLASADFRLLDPNDPDGYDNAVFDRTEKKFAFLSENDLVSDDLGLSADGDYQLQIYYQPEGIYYRNTINIGRKTADDFLWSNLAITYDTNTPTCGNGILETGEVCEPSIDPECKPDCRMNYCGDGFVLLGFEECDRINDVNVPVFECFEPYVPSWCAACSASHSSPGAECRGLDGTEFCCPDGAGGGLSGSCMNCQWSPSTCNKQCISHIP